MELLARRYRVMAENLLDAQSQVVRVEKLAGIGRLAAGVAHEVRNPLGALGSYIEVLQRRGADPKVTGDMHQAIDRIERIVQGLVDYARPGSARMPPISEQPARDLNTAVRTVLDFLEAQGILREQRLRSAGRPHARWYAATSTCWSRSSSTWWSMRARQVPAGGWWSVPCPRRW